jgi:hypothetical protein
MKEQKAKITDLLAPVTFAVFAVCILLVLLAGAKGHTRLVSRGGETFEKGTAVRYLTMRLRQAEQVDVADFDGCEALLFRERIDGEVYVTYVYCYDGYLRELFCEEDALLGAHSGEKILPAEEFSCALTDGLLTVRMDGRTLYLHLQGKEVAP